MKRGFSIFLIILIIILVFFVENDSKAQCKVPNFTFKGGESVTYHAYYNWGFIWVDAGLVNFSTHTESFQGKPVYKLTAIGKSQPKYDWIYHVRDTFVSHIDTSGLYPYKFMRKTVEGNYKVNNKYLFDYDQQRVYSEVENSEMSFKKDTLALNECVWDVLSAIYYVRNLDYESFKINEKKTFKIILDNEIHTIYIKYKGVEEIEIKGGKKYRCYKFVPLLVEGTIFESGEDMTVWVTADKNRIPVLVEAKILIGSVKAILSDTKGLRYEN